MIKVNAHLHSPYSFSAFKSIDEALDMAAKEDVKVVGINDFYTAAGYAAWDEGCKKRSLYPLFGIEFISLSETDQKAGLRVNDPGNPGRTYISGKGLSFPFKLSEPYASQLAGVLCESNAQVEAMLGKVNDLLATNNAGFSLDLQWIKSELTKGMLRERHLAKALRLKVYEACGVSARHDESRNIQKEEDIVGQAVYDRAIKALFAKIFGGKELKSAVTDYAGVENEIRGNLLKAGGAAFVPETPEAFLPVTTVQQIILAGGGIPTYPFLADDAKGGYTDFEGDLERVAKQLTERNFHSVEFITTRNNVDLLEKYASYLYEQGFVVTFGSEHNTPAMEPIELFARGGVKLTDKLLEINYKGACVVAAHQQLVAQRHRGYVDENGKADRSRRGEFEKLGEKLIATKTQNPKES
jgi:hypothetical protein